MALKQDRGYHEKQEDKMTTTEVTLKHTKEIPHWKCPGSGGVQGHWLEHFTTLHSRKGIQRSDMIVNWSKISRWWPQVVVIQCCAREIRINVQLLTTTGSFLVPPPLVWKPVTGIISTALSNYLELNGTLPAEQKGCRKNSRGTKDQLLIDKTVMIDCRKAYRSRDGMGWL